MPPDNIGRNWNDANVSQGMPRIDDCHQNLVTGKKEFSLTGFRGSTVLPIP